MIKSGFNNVGLINIIIAVFSLVALESIVGLYLAAL